MVFPHCREASNLHDLATQGFVTLRIPRNNWIKVCRVSSKIIAPERDIMVKNKWSLTSYHNDCILRTWGRGVQAVWGHFFWTYPAYTFANIYTNEYLKCNKIDTEGGSWQYAWFEQSFGLIKEGTRILVILQELAITIQYQGNGRLFILHIVSEDLSCVYESWLESQL